MNFWWRKNRSKETTLDRAVMHFLRTGEALPEGCFEGWGAAPWANSREFMDEVAFVRRVRHRVEAGRRSEVSDEDYNRAVRSVLY